jgi:hypothetical protein
MKLFLGPEDYEEALGIDSRTGFQFYRISIVYCSDGTKAMKDSYSDSRYWETMIVRPISLGTSKTRVEGLKLEVWTTAQISTNLLRMASGSQARRNLAHWGFLVWSWCNPGIEDPILSRSILDKLEWRPDGYLCSVWDWEKPVSLGKVVGVEMTLVVRLSKTEDIIVSFVSCKLLIFK